MLPCIGILCAEKSQYRLRTLLADFLRTSSGKFCTLCSYFERNESTKSLISAGSIPERLFLQRGSIVLRKQHNPSRSTPGRPPLRPSGLDVLNSCGRFRVLRLYAFYAAR